MTRRIVIVGAGQAGLAVAMQLRRLGFDGDVTLIGEEALPPYQRPPLSKAYLLGKLDDDRLLLKPLDFYRDQKIELLLGRTVEAVDLAAREVRLAGRTLPFDDLVLATGAAPRPLPPEAGGGLAGLYYLRNQMDALRLGPELQPGRRLLILGGGYIGLEVAAVARSRGLEVIVLEMADRILQRVAAPQTSDFFRKLHAAHGVQIMEGSGLLRLTGNSHISGADVIDGRQLPADLAVIGIGVLPRTALAEVAGIDVENGIRVDARGQTSVQGVWAVGDCCSLPFEGKRIRLESVPNANDQGAIVAHNILGIEKDYLPQPWFWSDQYDVKLQIAGLNQGYDRTVVRPAADNRSQSVWYFENDRLLSVDAMNEPRSYMLARRLLQKNASPRFEQIADPEFDPATLL